MNILKNMEAIFIVAVALSCASAYAKAPAPRTAPAPAITKTNKMITVVITGKRPAAAQKAQMAALFRSTSGSLNDY
jgi:hypothetical protein